MLQSRYHDLHPSGSGPESTVQFVLGSLLKARIECGFESDPATPDEEVNVYLVHLLSRLISSPDLGELTARGDIELFRKIRTSESTRFKCEVYRTNADHLLVATGIFTDTPYANIEGARTYASTARGRIGRGKAYYHYAASYQEQMRAGSPTLVGLLERLSSHFERYVDVLFHMRGEYFNLYDRFRGENFANLRQTQQTETEVLAPDSSVNELSVNELRDEFLDAYWVWQQEPTTANQERLTEAADRLRAADPDFDFDFEPPAAH